RTAYEGAGSEPDRPPAGEELPDQVRGAIRQDAARHVESMVEARLLQQVPERTGEPRLGVRSAEDNSVRPSEDDGSGAHRARLDGDVDRASLEVPPPRSFRGAPEREDLGMGGGILRPLALIA